MTQWVMACETLKSSDLKFSTHSLHLLTKLYGKVDDGLQWRSGVHGSIVEPISIASDMCGWAMLTHL